MSGFFVLARLDGAPIEQSLLDRIAAAQRFRGPDGNSVRKRQDVGGCAAFMRTGPGVQTEDQPAVIEDRLFLWGDIRLDGREELRRKLAVDGAGAGRSTTHEELLLQAWARWGENALEHVVGDFSFALWDVSVRTLWCARDFVGPRPFYYFEKGPVFACSNTLDLLRMVPGVSKELDEAFVGDFLLSGWSRETARTVYRHIRRLPAGHMLKFSPTGVAIRRFLKLPVEEPVRLTRPEEFVERYRDLLISAVSDRLRDGPTALYLSGGLDSGSVCAIAAELGSARQPSLRLKAFTASWDAVFADPEPALAKTTAAHLGVALEILRQTNPDPFEPFDSPDVRAPEPGGLPYFASGRKWSRQIGAHANVLLSGNGGDDVLTGQGWPYLAYLAQRADWAEILSAYGGYFWNYRRVPPLRGGFKSKLSGVLKSKDRFADYPPWLNREFEARLKLRDRWLELQSQKSPEEHPLHPAAYTALHGNYWAEVMETDDAGWNGVNVEMRAPLLDLRLLRFLLRLPPVPWCMNKHLCRVAMSNSLPQTIVTRPKTPLSHDPLEFCGTGAEWLERLPRPAPEIFKKFVNWPQWCETLSGSKGFLTQPALSPVSFFYWLIAVENHVGIQ